MQRPAFKLGGKIHRFWLKAIAWSINLEGELTWFATDDINQRTRKIDWEISIPRFLFRPICWVFGHSNAYGECVTCKIPMGDDPGKERYYA